MLKAIRWCFMGLCMAFANAHALPIHIVDPVTHKLLGADGVEVGGSLYDVRFVDGTCVEVFSGCDSQADLPFSRSSDAVAASEALNMQVFVDSGPGRNFDTNPGLTAGCSLLADPCDVYTPYEIPDLFLGFFVNAWASRNFSFFQQENLLEFELFSIDEDLRVRQAWAVWAPHAAPLPAVPEPETYAMLLAGLGLLGFMARRRKQNAA